jgi:hypothetical protein
MSPTDFASAGDSKDSPLNEIDGLVEEYERFEALHAAMGRVFPQTQGEIPDDAMPLEPDHYSEVDVPN